MPNKVDKIVEKLRRYRIEDKAKFIKIAEIDGKRIGFATFRTKNGRLMYAFMIRSEERDVVISCRDLAILLDVLYQLDIDTKQVIHDVLIELSRPVRKFEIEEEEEEEVKEEVKEEKKENNNGKKGRKK